MSFNHHNRHFNASVESGSTIPVFAREPKKRDVGFLVENKLQDLQFVPRGTAVEIDVENHTAKLLRTFIVKEKSENGAILARSSTLPQPVVGDLLIIAPDELDGKGTAFEVKSVEVSSNGYLVKFDGDVDVSEESILIESNAEASGAEAGAYCIPTEFAIHDTVGGSQNLIEATYGVKYVYKNTIPCHWTPALENITNVEFSKL